MIRLLFFALLLIATSASSLRLSHDHHLGAVHHHKLVFKIFADAGCGDIVNRFEAPSNGCLKGHLGPELPYTLWNSTKLHTHEQHVELTGFANSTGCAGSAIVAQKKFALGNCYAIPMNKDRFHWIISKKK